LRGGVVVGSGDRAPSSALRIDERSKEARRVVGDANGSDGAGNPEEFAALASREADRRLLAKSEESAEVGQVVRSYSSKIRARARSRSGRRRLARGCRTTYGLGVYRLCFCF
jgi:molecular chaperone DnaK (HSP70)